LFGLLDSAEVAVRGAASVGGCHSAAEVLVDGHFQV
jgi:hypothetical protein